MPKPVLIVLALVVVLAAAGLVAVQRQREAVAARPGLPAAPADAPVHHLALTDHTGQPFSDDRLRGRPALLYFGFTFCPDVCPTELGYIAKLLRGLGADADRLTPVFISIDPGRDSPRTLAEYVPLFDPRLIGLVGDQAQTDAVCAAFGIFHQKTTPVSKDPTYYLIDHTSTIFVLDAEGRIADTLDSETAVTVAIARIRRFLP